MTSPPKGPMAPRPAPSAPVPLLPLLVALLASPRLPSAAAAKSEPHISTVATSTSSSFNSGFAFPLLTSLSSQPPSSPSSPKTQETRNAVVFDGYQSQASGIYAAVADRHVRIAVTGSEPTSFSALDSASTSQAGTVFTGIESNGTTGIYFAAHDNPKEIITVVRTGVDQWGLGLIFSSVQNPSIGQSTKDGKGPGIAFEGQTPNETSGIFYVERPGDIPQMIAGHTTKFPGDRGTRSCLSGPVVVDNSKALVAFFASNCDGDSSASLLRRGKRMCRTRRADDHAVKDTASNLDSGIFMAYLGAVPVVIADFQTVPVSKGVSGGKLSKFETSQNISFEAFSNPAASTEIVSFIAATSDGNLGVYAYSLLERKLQGIVSTATEQDGNINSDKIETLPRFTDFPNPPSVAGSRIAFYASAGTINSGIYVTTPLFPESFANFNVSAVVTLADSTGAAGGGLLNYIGFGANAFNGNQIAFYAVTKVDGVFVADV